MTTQVTEVQILPIKANNGLVAFANLVLDNKLFISSIGIHSKLNSEGYRLTYPTKKIGEKNVQLFHPINKETSEIIEQSIFNKLKEVIEKSNDRHNSINV